MRSSARHKRLKLKSEINVVPYIDVMLVLLIIFMVTAPMLNANVGSISPYVGLFGTVWGIMGAFQGLGEMKDVTIAVVAPHISEALIATAMGLFAAIPAVWAYNRYANRVERVASRYEVFQEEFSSVLQRQIQIDDDT